MHYGMTYDEFWHGDPWMAKAFYEKHKLSRQQKNEEMWVNGMYQLKSLEVALNNAFNKHKIKYYEKPLDIFPKTEAEKQIEIRKQRQQLIQWLNQWKQLGNK